MGRPCLDAVLGVLLPPLQVFRKRGLKTEFFISLILTILMWFPGIFYCFHLEGVDCCQNILAILLPPVAVYMSKKCASEFWISLILTILIWLPGIIYAYYVI